MRFETPITRMLGIEHPILCGGMQWVSRGEFVAAAAEAGIMGFITAETFEGPEELRNEIRKTRDLTDRPFGVNISMVPEFALRDRTRRFAEVVCEENIPAVETAGRSPAELMEDFKACGIKVIHKLTSIRHALSAQKIGVDAITILGYASGGHVGMDGTAGFVLLPLAVKRLQTPVICGGAVADGKGLLGALAMGADAVLMGTAFFASEESPVHPDIKRKIVEASELDTEVVMRSVKNPLRCVRNRLVDQVREAEERGAGLEEILQLVSGGKGRIAYGEGDTEISPIACGQVAGLVDEIKPVKKIVDDIMTEASELMERLGKITGAGKSAV